MDYAPYNSMDIFDLFSYLERKIDIDDAFRGNDPKEIFEYFLNPTFDKKASFKSRKVNIRELSRFLVDDLSFDESRVKTTLSRLKKKQQQKSLDKFF